jgi:hypothetical protein
MMVVHADTWTVMPERTKSNAEQNRAGEDEIDR